MTEDPAARPAGIVKGLDDVGRETDKTQSLPPIHLWNPPFHGKIDMRIKADGTWLYLGTPIGRKRMVRLFSTVLRRDGDDYFLVTPVEKVGIAVDDAPFVAVELSVHGRGEAQSLTFRTNVDDTVTADSSNPIHVEIAERSQEPRPYVHVRRNLHALINRPVFYELVDLSVEETVRGTPYLGVWSAKTFFPIAPADSLQEV